MLFVFSAVSRDRVKFPANEDGAARRGGWKKKRTKVTSHSGLN